MHSVLYDLVDFNPDRRREVTRTDRRKSSDNSDNAQEISPPDRISTGVYRVAFRDAARSRELIRDNSSFEFEKSVVEFVSQTETSTGENSVKDSKENLPSVGAYVGDLESTS